MDLDIGQADRLAITHGAHGPDPVCDSLCQGAGPARPSAEPAQRFKPPVDRGQPPAGGNHLLPIGNQVMLAESLNDEGSVLDRTATGEEMAKILAISAHRRRGEILLLQTELEGRHPFRFIGGILTLRLPI